MNQVASMHRPVAVGRPASRAADNDVSQREDGFVWVFMLAPVSFVITLVTVILNAP